MPENTPVPAQTTFADLGVSQRLLEHLTKLQFITPTPIQAQAIPIAMTGSDVVGIAQTGTGKTLAFCLPMIQHISLAKKQGLIVLPTRELALQVEETIRKIGGPFGLRSAVIIGGASMGFQQQSLRQNPHVIIGTPGRLIDHLHGKTLHLDRVGVLVLDEADRMLDMGFAPQIRRILEHVPLERQTMLFSATMAPEIFQLASRYMKTPVRVEVAKSGTVAANVEQELFVVDRGMKNQLLDRLLAEYNGTVLVFSRTKYGAKKICRAIRGMDHTAVELHSNLSLAQRKRSLFAFKSGQARVLVATDIAARGIDVTNIELVINYDLPDYPDDYVHRVGRTGRAGLAGRAISFVAPDQRNMVRMIERTVRDRLRVSPLPELPAARPAPAGVEVRPTGRPQSMHHHQHHERRAPHPQHPQSRRPHQRGRYSHRSNRK